MRLNDFYHIHCVFSIDDQHEEVSTEQSEYKQEQANMDHLLQTMKTIVLLDEQLNEYRRKKPHDTLEIRRLENNFIQQMVEISSQLADPQLQRQVQDLTGRFQATELLIKLRPIVLSGTRYPSQTEDVHYGIV